MAMLSRFAVLSVSLTLKVSPFQGQSGTGYTNRGNVVRGNTFENIRMTDLHPNQGSFGNMNVQGLYLEGAGWDHEKRCLKRQEPKCLVVELPILQVIPIEASKIKMHGIFVTPVYVTQARRNAMGVGLVFEASLDTEEHSSHWVLQGVSLSLNTDA